MKKPIYSKLFPNQLDLTEVEIEQIWEQVRVAYKALEEAQQIAPYDVARFGAPGEDELDYSIEERICAIRQMVEGLLGDALE